MVRPVSGQRYVASGAQVNEIRIMATVLGHEVFGCAEACFPKMPHTLLRCPKANAVVRSLALLRPMVHPCEMKFDTAGLHALFNIVECLIEIPSHSICKECCHLSFDRVPNFGRFR